MTSLKSYTIGLVFVVMFLVAANVRADVLTGMGHADMPRYIVQLDKAWKYADGINVEDTSKEDTFRVFCSDLYTFTSDDFSGTGQSYKSVFLANSTFHTDLQKSQLQSLFDHVYTKAFNDDYSMNDPLYASIFQIAVWEIVHDSGNLSATSGNIQLTGAATLNANGKHYIDNNAFANIQSTLGQWYEAILNDSWDVLGYEYDPVTLTVWLAEGGSNVSQTFVGVNLSSVATPEPATLAIIGLGLAGLGLARRRITK